MSAAQAAPAIATQSTEGTPAPEQQAPATPPAAEGTPPTAQDKLWTDPPAPEAEKPAETSTPEWFMKDKYKTVDDQAKAHYDLQKLMGKNWGAPKDNYTTDGLEGISATDPLLEFIQPHLKELGLSQHGFATLMKGYTDAQVALAKKIEAEVTETLKRDEAMTVTAVDKWLHTAFNEEDRKTVQSWIVSVGDFQILNKLRLMMPTSSSVPSSTTGTPIKFESSKEVTQEKVKYRQEVNAGIRVADKNFENELQQRFRDAATRENNAKK